MHTYLCQPLVTVDIHTKTNNYQYIHTIRYYEVIEFANTIVYNIYVGMGLVTENTILYV